jgi:hypothetical protein
MARKLPLKKVMIMPPVGGAEQEFDYASTMLMIILAAPPDGRGVRPDEMKAAVEACKPIEDAVAAKAREVVMPDTHWQLLRDKTQTFPFGFAHRALWEFVEAILEAPEIGTEVGLAAVEAARKKRA